MAGSPRRRGPVHAGLRGEFGASKGETVPRCPVRDRGRPDHAVYVRVHQLFHMGFGSYDESEQESAGDAEIDDEGTVSVHEHDHEGDVSIEGGDDQDELLDRLQEMKE